MKVFIVLAVLCVCANASWAPAVIAPVAKVLSSGTSQSSRTQDSAGNYAFQYNEQHSTGGSSRQESGNGYAQRSTVQLLSKSNLTKFALFFAAGPPLDRTR